LAPIGFWKDRIPDVGWELVGLLDRFVRFLWTGLDFEAEDFLGVGIEPKTITRQARRRETIKTPDWDSRILQPFLNFSLPKKTGLPGCKRQPSVNPAKYRQ
jgi:hypothetical protein